MNQNITQGKFRFFIEKNFQVLSDLQRGPYPLISDFVEAMNSFKSDTIKAKTVSQLKRFGERKNSHLPRK